jgi:hypothetical protein
MDVSAKLLNDVYRTQKRAEKRIVQIQIMILQMAEKI